MRKLLRSTDVWCTVLAMFLQGIYVVMQYFVGKGHVYGWVEDGMRAALVALVVAYVPMRRLAARGQWGRTLGLALLAALSATRYNQVRYAPEGAAAVALLFARDAVFYTLVARGLVLFAGAYRQRLRERPRVSPADSLFRLAPFVGIASLTAVGLGCQWALNWPFRPTDDFWNQWGQIMTGSYNDIHALGHTIFLKALFRLYPNGGVAVLVHILMISGLYGLFAQHLCARGVPYKALMTVTAAVLCLLPASFLMYPWKDAPFAFVTGIVTYFILRTREEGYRLTWPHALGLGVCLGWMVLFRLNGVVPALASAAYFLHWARGRGMLRRVAAAALTALVCVGGVNAYGYRVLGAASPPNGYALQVFGSGVAAVVAREGNITPEQMARIEAALPVDFMREAYTPWDGTKLVWDEDYYVANAFPQHLAAHGGEVVRLYFELLPRNLGICALDMVYNTFEIWSVFYLFSNGTLLLLLGAALLGTRGARRGRVPGRWVLLIPIVASALSVGMTTITNEVRYFLATYILFVPILMYYLCVEEAGVAPLAGKE